MISIITMLRKIQMPVHFRAFIATEMAQDKNNAYTCIYLIARMEAHVDGQKSVVDVHAMFIWHNASHERWTRYPRCFFVVLLVTFPSYSHGLTVIRAWICNHMPSKVWNEITNPFPNFNDYPVEIWKWISNSNPHFLMDNISYPWED